MKTEMKMLPNGNYESVISPIQHECISKDLTFRCVKYSWKEKMVLKVEDGDPCEDGYANEIEIEFCPFCGYTEKKLQN